jgi:thioesterase domain-containing protein
LGETARYLWFRAKKGFDRSYAYLRRAVLFPIWGVYRRTGKSPPPWLRRPDRANHLIRLEHRRMPRYSGDATQFKAGLGPRSNYHPDAQETWRELIRGKLEVVTVPGLHYQIIHEPYAAVLAGELEKALNAARAKVDGEEQGTGT